MLSRGKQVVDKDGLLFSAAGAGGFGVGGGGTGRFLGPLSTRSSLHPSGPWLRNGALRVWNLPRILAVWGAGTWCRVRRSKYSRLSCVSAALRDSGS